MSMKVSIPQGAQPGSVFQVQQPDGQIISIQVPPGGMAGMEMMVPLQQPQVQATTVPTMQMQQQQYNNKGGVQVMPMGQPQQQFQQQQMGQPQQQQQFQQQQMFQPQQQQFQQQQQYGAAVVPMQQIATFPHPQNATLTEKYGGKPHECCDDPGLCLYGLCCYPCAVGSVASFVPNDSDNTGACCMYMVGVLCMSYCGLHSIVGCYVRGELEKKFALEHRGMDMPNPIMDCCCHIWCPCLAVTQELKGIQSYKNRRRGGPPTLQDEMTRHGPISSMIM